MPKLTNKIPSYRKHRASGKAIVTLDGKDFYLGNHGTRRSKREYEKLVSEWLARGRELPSEGEDLMIGELLLRYLKFADGYYRKNGRPTSEVAAIEAAIVPLQDLYETAPISEFGPLALKTVRERMVTKHEWSRTTVNAQVGRIRRMFKWGVENELVPASVLHGLQAVNGLRKGRHEVKESDPVRPVSERDVWKVLPLLPAPLAAMVELQWWTGMRPGEVVLMRGTDLDMQGECWMYTPSSHKVEHHGLGRTIAIGPRGREIVRRFLKREDLAAFLFSPRDAVVERLAERSANRKTPLRPSELRRKTDGKGSPGRPLSDHYTTATSGDWSSVRESRSFDLASEPAPAFGGDPDPARAWP